MTKQQLTRVFKVYVQKPWDSKVNLESPARGIFDFKIFD